AGLLVPIVSFPSVTRLRLPFAQAVAVPVPEDEGPLLGVLVPHAATRMAAATATSAIFRIASVSFRASHANEPGGAYAVAPDQSRMLRVEWRGRTIRPRGNEREDPRGGRGAEPGRRLRVRLRDD